MTIQEVEAKGQQLQADMGAALQEAKSQKPATPEFDASYGKYLAAKAALAKIPEDLAKAKLEANSTAIKTVNATVADAITQLVMGLKVAELLGAPVSILRYVVINDVATVVFNPTTRLSTKSKGERKVSNGHVQIKAPDGSKLSLTKFVLANATDAEKSSAAFKYPHTQVDSKPKFDVFCVAHNLTGYLYELPEVQAEAAQPELTAAPATS